MSTLETTTQLTAAASLSLRELLIRATLKEPNYNPAELVVGIMAFGAGKHALALLGHIAHLLAEAGQLEWGIAGVRSGFSEAGREVTKKLREADLLYILTSVDPRQSNRFTNTIIGSLRELLVVNENPATISPRLADPNIKLATVSVDKKNYCLNGRGELDWDNQDIKDDQCFPMRPKTLIGQLAAGLHLRLRHPGSPPLAIVACDNFPQNGVYLKRALVNYCKKVFPKVAEELERVERVCVLSSVADRIAPEVCNASLSQDINNYFKLRAPVAAHTEPFLAWVIEQPPEKFKDCLPNFCVSPELCGRVITVENIDLYFNAKLRTINNGHIAIGLLGQLMKKETVLEAISHTSIKNFVTGLLEEASQAMAAPAEVIDMFKAEAIFRFGNKKIGDRLDRLTKGLDGKFLHRVLIENMLQPGAKFGHAAMVIAAWLAFDETITDDKKAQARLKDKNVFDCFSNSKAFRETVIRFFNHINKHGIEHALTHLKFDEVTMRPADKVRAKAKATLTEG